MVSSRPRTYSTNGLVIRLQDLGEADRLFTILTPERGILRAVARSARKPKSRLGGHLDLLRHVSLSVREGRTLDNISQAETVSSFRKLRNSLARMSRGIYMAELAEKFSVEGGSNPVVFRLLVSGLAHLEEADQPDMLVRWYELCLLRLSGFQPGVSTCVECSGTLEQEEHVFSAERGGIVCPDCRAAGGDILLPAGVPAIKVLRHLSRSEWPAVDGLRVGSDDLHQVDRILREHMQYVMDRVVKSTAFMDEVRKWQPGMLNAW